MDISLFRVCQILGVPPRMWMVSNPFKVYEFQEVVAGSELKQKDSILDLGCGKGHWTLLLAGRCGRAIGVDMSKDKIAVARRFARNSLLKNRIQFFCTRFEEADFPLASIDHVFSFCVLEHIENLEEVLTEAFRILRPAGQLHVSVDSLANIKDETLRDKHKRDHSVTQYFTETSLRQRLEMTGFEVMNIHPILKGDFARQEFEKRIKGGCKKNLVARLHFYRRFRQEDRKSESHEGIMLIGHARRLAGK